MLVRKVTRDALESALMETSAQYGGNIGFSSEGLRPVHRSAFRFRLWAQDLDGEGWRYSASGRRTHSASWEVHRDFMRAVYRQCPDAVFVTALATYRGARDFERSFPGTYWQNAGSPMFPVSFGSPSA